VYDTVMQQDAEIATKDHIKHIIIKQQISISAIFVDKESLFYTRKRVSKQGGLCLQTCLCKM
jgi:hypothetical protein